MINEAPNLQLAEPIRCLLHFTGTDFEDKQYDILGEFPNFSAGQWTTDKESLPLEFPNVSADLFSHERYAKYTFFVLLFVCM